MEKYFYYETSGYHRYAVVKDNNGNYVFYDIENQKQSIQAADGVLGHFKEMHPNSWMEMFETTATEVKVKSINELFQWIQKYNELTTNVELAEASLLQAKGALEMFLNPVIKMSLSELRDKGYIYKVFWNSLERENTKIGDCWFTEEEANKEIESLKQAFGKEYNEENCYIYNASDEMDDQIDDEKSINENTM